MCVKSQSCGHVMLGFLIYNDVICCTKNAILLFQRIVFKRKLYFQQIEHGLLLTAKQNNLLCSGYIMKIYDDI